MFFLVDENWQIHDMGPMLRPDYHVYPLVEIAMPGLPVYNLLIEITEINEDDESDVTTGDLQFICSSISHTMAVIDNHKKHVKSYQIYAQTRDGNKLQIQPIKKIFRGVCEGQKTYIFEADDGDQMIDFGVNPNEVRDLKTIYRRGVRLVD